MLAALPHSSNLVLVFKGLSGVNGIGHCFFSAELEMDCYTCHASWSAGMSLTMHSVVLSTRNSDHPGPLLQHWPKRGKWRQLSVGGILVWFSYMLNPALYLLGEYFNC